jgi:hypothetical protein
MWAGFTWLMAGNSLGLVLINNFDQIQSHSQGLFGSTEMEPLTKKKTDYSRIYFCEIVEIVDFQISTFRYF